MGLDKEELRKQAISECEREVKSLNDFVKNEGHTNKDVMLTVVNRIAFLEKTIDELRAI